MRIRPEQTEPFIAAAEERFVSELAEHLCQRNTAVLPRFPEEQRLAIVRFMIARGKIWGATWKSSLGLYADLMQTVAPNFDHHPTIREAIQTGTGTADDRIMSLADRIPRSAWIEAESSRIELFLYTDPEVDTAPLLERTAAALPIVLWDHIQPEKVSDEARKAIGAADELGLADSEDGPITAAVAFALYGPQLKNEGSYPWMNDILDSQRQPNERLEMLRFRIALDFGRRV